MKMNLYIYLVVIILLSACGGGGSSSSKNIKQASKLTISDFVVNSRDLSITSFKSELNKNNDFFLKDPNSDDSAIKECINDAIESATENYVFKRDTDNTFYMDISIIDISTCIPEGDNTKFYTSIFVNKLIVTNDFGLIVNIEGMSLKETANLKVVQRRLINSTSIKTNQNELTLYKATIGSNGFNSICNFQEQPVKCTIREVSTLYEDGKKVYSNETVLTSNVTFANQDDRYFDSGTIDFKINNWDGVMSYMGANINPTYTAQSDNGYITSGIFNYSTTRTLLREKIMYLYLQTDTQSPEE